MTATLRVSPAHPTASRRQQPALADALWQALLVAAVVALAAALGRAGFVARIVFVLAGIISAEYYSKRSPWLLVTLTFWFWTLTPFVRRLIDLQSGFDSMNFILATPNLMALFMLRDILNSRDVLRLREAAVGLFALLPMIYGLAASLVQGSVLAGFVAAADWFAPLLYYFFFIVHFRRIHEAEDCFRVFLGLNAAIIVGYGLLQYFRPPIWDVTWVIDSGLITLGSPEPYKMRVFSTLNLPGLLAVWLGTQLLLLAFFKPRFWLVLLPATAVLLLLTQVRSVAGCTVLALAVAALLGRPEMLKSLLSAVVVVVVLAGIGLTLDPEMSDRIGERFSTLNSLDTDNSALVRAELYRAAPDLLETYALGGGIGLGGRGAVVTNNLDMMSIDSGFIAIYLSLGWVAGSVYILGLFILVAQVIMAARASRSPIALGFAVATVAAVGGIVFVNIIGFFAAVLWLCAGYATAIGIRARNPAI